jgi:hypothetical protein
MSFPPAPPHGELREIFDGVHFVTGQVRIGSPIPMRLSRSMTVVRSGESLALLNSMRLDDDGLKALDALGKVEHVIRIGAFHGMDDPFYQQRYGATVWALAGSAYMRGFEASDDPADGRIRHSKRELEKSAAGEWQRTRRRSRTRGGRTARRARRRSRWEREHRRRCAAG